MILTSGAGSGLLALVERVNRWGLCHELIFGGRFLVAGFWCFAIAGHAKSKSPALGYVGLEICGPRVALIDGDSGQ